MSLSSCIIPGQQGEIDGHRYTTGTIFCSSPNVDRRQEGRIVGFDVERRQYQVYYPKIDAELHLLEESDLDRSHMIVQDRHIRPGGRGHVDDFCGDDDDDISCPICFEVFASDPSDKLSGRLPIQARHCGHVICMDCFQKRRIETTKSGVTTRKGVISFRASMDCPICRREESFVADSIVVCLTMCQLVDRCKKVQHKKASPVLASKKLERSNDCNKRRSSADAEILNPRKKTTRHHKKSNADNDSTIISLQYPCTRCKVTKPKEKFSGKQADRAKHKKSDAMCRRCEEKCILKKDLGPTCDNGQMFQLYYCAEGSRNTQEKFLTTAIPWPLMEKKSPKVPPQFPTKLTLDGYTRETWSLLSNPCLSEHTNTSASNNPWNVTQLYGTGSKMNGLCDYLRGHKKSTFGTFVLPCGTDGFFVIPYDQPSPQPSPNIFVCKYVLGMGLVGPNAATISVPSDFVSNDDASNTKILEKLLVASKATNKSLSIIPKGSVQVAKKDLSLPKQMTTSSRGVKDWFRPRAQVVDTDEKDTLPCTGRIR
jgi:hypothetical protein